MRMCETPLSAAISAIAGAIWGACVQYSLRLRGISSAWPVFKIVIFGRGPNPILSVKSPAVINPLFALSVRSMTLATPAKLSSLKSLGFLSLLELIYYVSSVGSATLV